MRRSEFLSLDEGEFEEISISAIYGSLGIILPDGYPRVVPVNFATVGRTVYFHGARAGEKYEVLKGSPKVTFSIVVPYSFIPSYHRSERYACPASFFFKSILIRGLGSVVSDPEESCLGLNLLMRKYQPEGRYEEITVDSPIYRSALKEVCVFKIEPTEVTVKVKFGQNMSEKDRESVVSILRERNSDGDVQSIHMIRALSSPSS